MALTNGQDQWPKDTLMLLDLLENNPFQRQPHIQKAKALTPPLKS